MTYSPSSGLMNAGVTVEVAMQHSLNLPKEASSRPRGVCDTMFVGVVFCTLLHATEALAGEQAPLSGPASHPDFGVGRPMPLSAMMDSIPERFQAGTLSEPKTFSNEEFRPRTQSAYQTPPSAPVENRPPVENGPKNGTVWERFADFRSRNQVRLLTLWQAGGSSLSLQAGRKGPPSLQWTSRLMNRGGAPRGVLDELLPDSLGRTLSRGLHLTPHGPTNESAGRPAKSADGPIR
jgi:hypothetical protein